MDDRAADTYPDDPILALLAQAATDVLVFRRSAGQFLMPIRNGRLTGARVMELHS